MLSASAPRRKPRLETTARTITRHRPPPIVWTTTPTSSTGCTTPSTRTGGATTAPATATEKDLVPRRAAEPRGAGGARGRLVREDPTHPADDRARLLRPAGPVVDGGIDRAEAARPDPKAGHRAQPRRPACVRADDHPRTRGWASVYRLRVRQQR